MLLLGNVIAWPSLAKAKVVVCLFGGCFSFRARQIGSLLTGAIVTFLFENFAVYTFGNGRYGQIGQEKFAEKLGASIVEVDDDFDVKLDESYDSPNPVKLELEEHFVKAAGGRYHSLLLTSMLCY